MKKNCSILLIILISSLSYAQNSPKDELLIQSINKEALLELFTDTTYSVSRISKPDWKKIAQNISKKYGPQYLDQLPGLKKVFYRKLKDWDKYAEARMEMIKLFPPRLDAGMFEVNSTWQLNSDAWDIFLNCKNVKVLELALGWIELAINIESQPTNVQYLDTKANLLYKLGRKLEAINLEEKVLSNLRKEFGSPTEGGAKALIDEYEKNLKKMKEGLPTWETTQVKPALSLDVMGSSVSKFDQVGEVKISPNGKYVYYLVSSGRFERGKMILQSIDGKWKLEKKYTGRAFGHFTYDSKSLVCQLGADTMQLIELGSDKKQIITGVTNLKFTQVENSDHALYIDRNRQEMVLRNLNSEKEHRYSGIKEFTTSNSGLSLVLHGTGEENESMYWLDLKSKYSRKIWQGSNPSNLTFDPTGSVLAFKGRKDQGNIGLWLYHKEKEQAIALADSADCTIEPNYHFREIVSLSKGGRYLFYNIQEPALAEPAKDAVLSDVWHYRDLDLMSYQLENADSYKNRNFLSMLDCSTKKTTRIQRDFEEVIYQTEAFDDFVFLKDKFMADPQSAVWINDVSSIGSYCFDITKGKREKWNFEPVSNEAVSPDRQFVLLRSQNKRILYSRDLPSGRTVDLSTPLNLPMDLITLDQNVPSQTWLPNLDIAGWTIGNRALFLYDRYDIWQVDPSGKLPAICITKGYGRKLKIRYRFIDEVSNSNFRNGEKRILAAFNYQTKESGFYQTVLGTEMEPVLLNMASAVYFVPDLSIDGDFRPIKASSFSTWLVKRSTASGSPNIYFTKDFKNFGKISDVHPEKEFNWMTSEVVSLKLADGSGTQAVIYRPEDFDPSRKYPVIVHYYEQLTDHANQFHYPFLMTDNLNIPWFVSNGYVVVTPDIHYKWGHVGENALNTIIATRDFLVRQHWVDSLRIGIQGHSWGGYETNYILTRTTLFRAAMSSSGPADLIASIFETGDSGWNQFRFPYTYWANPKRYLEDSPVLHADKVTTPLMLMSNKQDYNVRFNQGEAFFTALRRLGKRVWLTQYDGSAHTISDDAAARLHTVRVTQFFDHYLKGKPAPIWMTRGIPLREKGLNYGLDYDLEIETPGKGLVSDMELRSMEKFK